jgi:hypothetical protein
MTVTFLRKAVEIEKQYTLMNQNLKNHERPRLPSRLYYLRNEEKDADVYLLGCNHSGDSAGSLSPEVPSPILTRSPPDHRFGST